MLVRSVPMMTVKNACAGCSEELGLIHARLPVYYVLTDE